MTTLTIPLPTELSSRLHEVAERLGVSAEELARAGLEDWLCRPRDEFAEAARHVLEKNKELYRRLA
jgi:predicted transcriptional regulator